MSQAVENRIRFLRLPQVKQKAGYSRSAIYAKVALGQFPAPINLGARAVAWIESEIDAWIEARVSESRSMPLQRQYRVGGEAGTPQDGAQ